MKNITYYQMANRSDEDVKSQFVVRQNEYDQVISEVKRDTMTGSIQHYVFVGQRGSGKSTLLRRIQAEVNTNKKLTKRLIAVNLSEEQAGIYRLHDLWDRVGQELENQGLTVEKVAWEEYGNDMTGYAKTLYMAIQKALKKEKKKLILLLDNIDRIFETIKQDQHLFRELLMNHKDVRIVGGSTRLSEHHWKYDAPFYEFFSIIRLESLTREELRELLLFWGEFFEEPSLKAFVEKHPGKLEAIRILSDGMPRTMLHLIELLIHEPEKHGYDYLQQIVDRATPIYQERLGTLSPSHQKILLELSFFWDAIKVKELVGAVKMESKTVSAMLKQLVDLRIVEKVSGEGRNHFYRLKERFFNLWLVMTQGGPRQKNQVKWLTIFLETWYDKTGLRDYYEALLKKIGEYQNENVLLVTKALTHSKYLSIDDRDRLILEFGKIVSEDSAFFLPKVSSEIYTEAMLYTHAGQFDSALEVLDSIEQQDGRKSLLSGVIYICAKQYEGAIEEFTRALEGGFDYAVLGLGVAHLRGRDFLNAHKYFKLAVDQNIFLADLFLAEYYSSTGSSEHSRTHYGRFARTFYELEGVQQLEVDQYMLLLESWFLIDKKSFEECLKVAVELGYVSAKLDLFYIKYEMSNTVSRLDFLDFELIGVNELRNIKDRSIWTVLQIWLNGEVGSNELFRLIEDLIKKGNSLVINWLIQQLLNHHQLNLVNMAFYHSDFGSELKDICKLLYMVSTLLPMKDKEEGFKKLGYSNEFLNTVLDLLDAIQVKQRKYYTDSI